MTDSANTMTGAGANEAAMPGILRAGRNDTFMQPEARSSDCNFVNGSAGVPPNGTDFLRPATIE